MPNDETEAAQANDDAVEVDGIEPDAPTEDAEATPPDEGGEAPDADGSSPGAPIAADLEPLALPLWKLVAGGVVVVLVVLVAVVAAVVLIGDDDGGGGGGDGPAARASIVDTFDRADAPNELGATDSGQPWTAESGVWGIRDGEAVLVEPNPDGLRSIAVVDTGSSNGTVSATAGTMTAGWGLVFRYQGPFNYWYITASPDFATYNLARVVDGEVQPLGGVGLAGVDDGSVVQVRLDGATIEISINGNPVKAITDTTLMGATKAGLVAAGQSAAQATWASFEAAPTGAASGAVTPQTVPPPEAGTSTPPAGEPAEGEGAPAPAP